MPVFGQQATRNVWTTRKMPSLLEFILRAALQYATVSEIRGGGKIMNTLDSNLII